MQAGREPRTVLVVEDDPSIRLLLREVLRAAGWRTVEAPDGATALAAAEEAPAVVLLDVGLPDMDGLDVLERLKADGRLAAVPVVIVTAWGDAERVQRALAAGAHGYLRKPFDAREVVACVESAARGGEPAVG